MEWLFSEYGSVFKIVPQNLWETNRFGLPRRMKTTNMKEKRTDACARNSPVEKSETLKKHTVWIQNWNWIWTTTIKQTPESQENLSNIKCPENAHTIQYVIYRVFHRLFTFLRVNKLLWQPCNCPEMYLFFSGQGQRCMHSIFLWRKLWSISSFRDLDHGQKLM